MRVQLRNVLLNFESYVKALFVLELSLTDCSFIISHAVTLTCMHTYRCVHQLIRHVHLCSLLALHAQKHIALKSTRSGPVVAPLLCTE